MDGYEKQDIEKSLEVAINTIKLNLNYVDRIIRTTDDPFDNDDIDDEKRDD